MTTASWSTVLDQTSDAAFRAWGSELSTKFAAVGMVQTADTGQINWTTVTRASTNTAAGYEIWRLSGSALYFKIEYGSGSATTTPSLWITVGTGSNGTGTITGQSSTRTQVGSPSTAIISTVTSYQSYLCATASYFGLAWKIGSGSAGFARQFIVAAQTVDNTGAASSVGYYVLANTGSGTSLYAQNVATTAGVTGSALTNLAASPFFVPGNSSANPASSADGAGNNQAFVWWYQILGTTPMSPLLHAATVLKAELTLGNTASMTLVGSSAHTYLSATQAYIGDAGQNITNTNLAYLMLYE